MSNARNIASGAKFVDTAGDTMTGRLSIQESAAAGEGILLINSRNVAGTYSDLKWAYSVADQSYGSGLRFKQVDTTHGGQLEFYTDNASGSYTKQMQITENGHVTMPNQPSFFARGSGNNWVSISNGNRSSPTYATPIFNTGSHFNTSNGRFTAPVNGLYYFMFHPYVKMNSASDIGYYGTTEILVNGNLYNGLETIYGYYNAADYDQVQPVTAIISLSASDYVTTAVQANNADVSFYERGCYFMGYLIG